MKIKFKKLRNGVRPPKYATDGSGAFDIYYDNYAEVEYGTITKLNTGIAVELPRGYSLFLFSRSGHGANHGVRLANCVGIIDSDYRGEIIVPLTKDLEGDCYKIFPYDRVCQGIVFPTPVIEFEEVEELSTTERGEGGFGSTG